MVIGQDETLHEGVWRHAIQQLQSTEMKAGCLHSVGGYCLDSCEYCTENRHQETECSCVVVPVGCEAYPSHYWDQRDVGLRGVGGAEDNAVDADCEDGADGTHDLVERDGNEIPGDSEGQWVG